MALQVSYEEMRSLVAEMLAKSQQDQIKGLCVKIANLAHERGLIRDPNAGRGPVQIIGQFGDQFSSRDEARVLSIIWDLIIEGVVRPGLNDGTNNNLPHFHVTEYGQKVLQEGPQTPYDPDSYLDRLRTDLPNLDATIVMYLNESLHTFRIGCLLSSTITLVCASEKALLLLIDAYAAALPQSQQDKFRKDTEGRMIKRVFEEFSKRLESHLKPKLPGDLKDDLDVTLSGVFSMIRNMRNDAGHPTGRTVAREVAYANLAVFPTSLRRMYALIDWLKANPGIEPVHSSATPT